MKKVLVGIIILSAFFDAAAQKKTKVVAKPVVVKSPFKNLSDSFSYAAGYAVASNMKTQNVRRINTLLMQKAIDDVYKNRPLLIDAASMNDVLQRQSQVFADEKMKDDKIKEAGVKVAAAAEITKGEAFLNENKKRKEVITLPSGLQYEVIVKAPDSATLKPRIIDTVVVNYIGTLIDGKEFENSYKRGQPATYQVTGFIKGWIEILQLMRVGDKWKVYIPTEMAYYLSPRDPNLIAPGAALVFELTLEGIKPAGN